MKTLYLDCAMGAAGDMLTAALLELCPDRDAALAALNALGIPGVEYHAAPAVKCGITGTHVTVTVNGAEEDEHLHEHHHAHDHADHDHHDEDHEHHHHHHSGMHEITHILEALPVSDRVRTQAAAVYGRIAEAESRVHGIPVTEIHFHEVGTMDAVADVVGFCFLLEKLAPDRVVVSPVHVGSGQVRCAHGILPVPAPATADILKDVPIYSGEIKGELCTPTGAALLKQFADAFGPMPMMRTEAIGYGMGKKDFPAANCVRAMLGETAADRGGMTDTVTELRCNLDDMTPEAIGFARRALLEAGALDVWTTAIDMKKDRPGIMLSVLCQLDDRERFVGLLFRHTTTLGVRETLCRRCTLERSEETVETAFGPVRRKIAAGWGVRREKYEYEDLAAIARRENLSLEALAAKLP